MTAMVRAHRPNHPLEYAYGLVPRSFDKVLEHARPRRMPQLSEGFDFYLPNALSRDLKVFAHLFQSPFTPFGVQSKPQANNLFLSWAQGLEHITGNVTQVGSDHSFGRTDR